MNIIKLLFLFLFIISCQDIITKQQVILTAKYSIENRDSLNFEMMLKERLKQMTIAIDEVVKGDSYNLSRSYRIDNINKTINKYYLRDSILEFSVLVKSTEFDKNVNFGSGEIQKRTNVSKYIGSLKKNIKIAEYDKEEKNIDIRVSFYKIDLIREGNRLYEYKVVIGNEKSNKNIPDDRIKFEYQFLIPTNLGVYSEKICADK